MENFVNAGVEIQDGDTTIYTCPAGTKAIVIGCQATNVVGSNSTINVGWTDSSDSDVKTYLGYEIVVPLNSSYEPVSGKLVLEAGDTIFAKSVTHSVGFNLTASILELS
jgi:hypothetical protein